MANKKSVEDRFQAIQQYCSDGYITLGLHFDPVTRHWSAYDQHDAQLAFGCDDLEELVEALEAEFSL